MKSDIKNIGILITDANLIVRSWDGWLGEVTGIAEDKAVGQSLISLIPDLEKRGLLTRFQQVLAEGSTEILAPAFHHYLIPCKPQLHSEHFDKMQQRVTIAPLRESDKIVGTIITIEDVTARIERERIISQQLASLDENTRIKAAKILSTDESPELSNKLLDSLDDKSWRVRRVAVEGLVWRKDSDTTVKLLRALRYKHHNPSVLNSVLQVLSMNGIDTISPLAELLNDSDSNLRIYVALALGELRDPRAIHILIAALKDSDVNVRYHAIEALGKLRAVDAVEELVTIAESRDFFLAFPALDALTYIGDPRISTRLVPLLEDELLRAPAAEALSYLGDEDIVVPLAELMNKPGAAVKVIARSLAVLHNRYERIYHEAGHIANSARKVITEVGIANLLAAIENTDDSELNYLALILGWLDGPMVERALTQLLGRPIVRKEIVEALVRHGSGVVNLLIDMLDSEDLEIRRTTIIALGRIGDSRAVPALVRLLNEESEIVIVAGALAKIGNRQAFEALLKLIGHPDATVRQAVIASLNSLGHPEMPKYALKLLNDPNPYVRESMVKIVGYFGFPECVDLLLERCRDNEENVRRAAIEHLAYIEDDRVIPTLIAALKNETPWVRAAAAHTFGQVEDNRAFSCLLSALEDEDPWVRYYAARSLGRQGYTDALDPLARIIQSDTANHVRIAAIEALGRIGGSRAVTILAPLVESGESDLERVAMEALGMIPHPDAQQPLLAVLKSSDSHRKVSALRALGRRGETEVANALQWTAAAESDKQVVQAAIEALTKIATPEAIAALVELTVDPTRREACVVSLSSLGDDQIETIASGLIHAQPSVRIAVVDCFARMKRTSASERLSIALDDPVPSVRLAAVKALGQLGSRFADKKIAILARTDLDSSVRSAADKVLRR
jgi:HEAT repeat protein